MIRVYVAGAMQADNILGVLSNLRRGIKLGADLLKLGFAPYVPHLDFQLTLADDEQAPLDDYYTYTMEWLRASEAILVCPQSENSTGVKFELAEATCLGIPIYYSIDDLMEARRKQEEVEQEKNLDTLFTDVQDGLCPKCFQPMNEHEPSGFMVCRSCGETVEIGA